MWRRASVLLLLLPATAHAHPGHGPQLVEVRDFENRFDPPTVTAGVGDTVIWNFGGPLRNHSVTADDGSFDSGQGPHPANHQFTHRFVAEGTFAYHCAVHPQMYGQVTVVPVGTADVDPPRLTDVRVSRRRGRYRLHFTISELGDVLARIRRGGKTVRAFDASAKPGENRTRIPTAGLDPARYKLLLTAYDRADNGSKTVRTRFRVRR